MPTTLISPGFSLVRGIRFTLQFRETITIAARAKDRAPKGAAMQHAPAVAVTAGDCCNGPSRLKHKEPRRRAPWTIRAKKDWGKTECRGALCARLRNERTRSGNEGVGEHVRTRFHLALRAR
jgi:hypothetical protein